MNNPLRLFMLTALVGCAAEVPTSTRTAESPSSVEAAPLAQVAQAGVAFSNFHFEGSLCPPDSVAPNPGASVLTVTSAGQPVTGANSCIMTFDVTVPDGVTISSPIFSVTTYSLFGLTDVTMSATYGGRTITSPTHRTRVDNDDVFRLRTDVATPTCGRSRTVPVTFRIDATLTTADEQFSAPQFDVNFTSEVGAVWKTCSGNVIGSQLAKKGEDCAGLANRGCESPLLCDLKTKDKSQTERKGVCVEAGVERLRSRVGGPCGGVRRAQCDTAVAVCSYQYPEESAYRNVCVERVGPRVGSYCGGTPNVPCARGLGCRNSECQAADGTAQAICGQGLTACMQGLECNSPNEGLCVPRSAGEGELCSTTNPCRAGSRCDARRRTCVRSLPGEENSRCDQSDPTPNCQAGLACIFGACRAP